jgi:hypothetical protein
MNLFPGHILYHFIQFINAHDQKFFQQRKSGKAHSYFEVPYSHLFTPNFVFDSYILQVDEREFQVAEEGWGTEDENESADPQTETSTKEDVGG